MVQGMHLTPIGKGAILLEPGEGLDPSRPDDYLLPLLTDLQRHQGTRLIYDLSDVVVVDHLYYAWLKKINNLCRFAGVEMMVANMRPPVAYTLAATLGETPPFRCMRDVDRARSADDRPR